MNYLFIISIILALSSRTGCQQDQPCNVSKGSYIQIGAQVKICLKIKTENNTYVYAFGLTVDKLSALQIIDIGDTINDTGKVSLVLEYQKVVSQEILLQDQKSTIFQNLASFVLQSTDGVITKVYSDVQDCTSCLTSNHQACLNSQCFNVGDLSKTNKILIYISWIGTDLDGQHFVSHTMRLKKLNMFTQQNIFLSALTLIPQ